LSQLIIEDEGLRRGVYLYNGKLTFAHVAKYFSLSYHDLNLLLATFR
jgi:alanine dehydrogenase